MTEQEFYDEISKRDRKHGIVKDYLVLIKLKHLEDEPYRFTRELYLVDLERGSLPHLYHCWENDWYEGEQFVEILGFIDLDDVEIPYFEKENKQK